MDVVDRRSIYFSRLIAIFPLLGVYRSPIPGVDIGTVAILIFFLLSLRSRVPISDITIMILYILLQTPLVVIFSSSLNVASSTVLLRYGKLMITLGVVFFLGLKNECYREDYAFKTVRWVCYLCAVFIFLQRVFYIFGMTVVNPLLNFATSDLYTSGYSSITGGLFRPSAFFLEPAHMALYGIVFLCYALFKSENLKDATIVSVAILCTGSGIGLIAVVSIMTSYLLIRFKKHLLRSIVLLFLFVGLVLLLSQTVFFQQVISRFATSNITGGGNALNARIGIGYQLFSQKTFIEKCFGSGYGNVPTGVYLNGITYIINTLGIVGLVIFAVVVFRLFLRGAPWQKIGIALFAVLTGFSQIFTPASLVFYFCVYSNMSRKREDDELYTIIEPN